MQATSRIEIGTGILNPYTTHPAEMAMFAATMDELSGNRFNLGLAAGAGSFLDWIGLEQARPLAAVPSVPAMRSLLCAASAPPWTASGCSGRTRHICVSARLG
ncbi:MAG: LLM class flavin-dependent oxidoreductase [Caldilineaceae bacterium]